MFSSTLCHALHILGSQTMYSRAEGTADHYWPWAVFFWSLLDDDGDENQQGEGYEDESEEVDDDEDEDVEEEEDKDEDVDEDEDKDMDDNEDVLTCQARGQRKSAPF